MDMKVHCPGCTKSLRVPKTSSGRKARCPSCQKVFIVPAPEDLVDETISTWIEDDVGKLEVEHEKQWEAIGSIKAYQRPGPTSAGSAASASTNLHKKPGPNGTATPVGTMGPDNSTIVGVEDMKPLSNLPAGTSIEVTPSPPPAADASRAGPSATGAATGVPTISRGPMSGEAQDQPYPTALRVDALHPHLVVVRCDQAGVCFAFDSIHLENMGFRMSIPVCCAFSGDAERRKLFARPLAFIDRSGARIRSPQEIESKYTTSLLSGQSSRELLDVIGSIDALPKPFSFCTPYYGTHEFSHSSLKCWTETRSDGGITCFVVIPNGPTALQWLMNVNGACGFEYDKLANDITLLDNDAWRQIGDECRRRLAVWCPFESMEHFRLYLSDGDFGTRDKGLAGLVFTDRRLVYCKYHHRGSVDLSKPATLHVREDNDFAHLTLETDSGKVKLVKLHTYDVPILIEAMTAWPHITIDRAALAAATTG